MTTKTVTDSKGREWTREAIVALLKESPLAVERAILTIYARQTASEQETEQTTQDNGVGFSGFDGEIFSSFAKQIQKSTRPAGQRLSPKQLAVARKEGKNGCPRIGRYAAQLLSAIAPATPAEELAA